MKKSLVVLSALAGSTGLTSAVRADVQLPYGRYIGYVQATGSDRKVALTLDTFVVQPNDLTQFPRLDAIVKVSLGGPKGNEYVTEYYEDAAYDFTDGVLTLSNAQTDLSMTLNVVSAASTTLDGQAFLRTAGVSGTVHFDLYDPDNPDAPNGGVPLIAGDAPLLAGQYRGTCSGLATALQIETGKGFLLSDNATHGLSGYQISGRLAVVEAGGGLCMPGALCVYRSYHDSNFDLYSGRLVLNSDLGTDTCSVSTLGAHCEFHLGVETRTCDLLRDATSLAPDLYHRSRDKLTTTPAQTLTLPALDPPANAALTSSLSGDYIGYLYNESSNHYQVMRLSVLASSSTNNPHNENLVYVTGGTTLHFGDAVSSDFFVQPFEPRSFYLAPGFTLESPDSDAFVQVQDWRAGYVTGAYFSHSFGRVGTFELIKGTQLPLLAANAPFVPGLNGNFTGSGVATPGTAWWVTLTSPNQPAPKQTVSTFDFVGDFMLMGLVEGGNLTVKMPLAHGEYDFYTGSISWLTTEHDGGSRLVAGHVLDDGSLTLVWPSAPQIGMVTNFDHSEKPFEPRQ